MRGDCGERGVCLCDGASAASAITQQRGGGQRVDVVDAIDAVDAVDAIDAVDAVDAVGRA